MKKKEFRHLLLEILNKAGVSQTLSREKFINLSWHKFNNGGLLFHDATGKDACMFVQYQLKKAHVYYEYRAFMGDPLFNSFEINKE